MKELPKSEKFPEIGGKTYKGGQNRVIFYPNDRPPPFNPPRPIGATKK